MLDPAYVELSRRYFADAKKHEPGVPSPAQPSPGAKGYEEKLHRGHLGHAIDAYVRSMGSHAAADVYSRNTLTMIEDLAEMRARRDGAGG